MMGIADDVVTRSHSRGAIIAVSASRHSRACDGARVLRTNGTICLLINRDYAPAQKPNDSRYRPA